MVMLTQFQRDMLLYLANPHRFRSMMPLLCSVPVPQRCAAVAYLVSHNLVQEISGFNLEYHVTNVGWMYIDNLWEKQLLLEVTNRGDGLD
jgi:hypothetical protein